jgi:uncharacterized protein YpuA (DUF1002 family)
MRRLLFPVVLALVVVPSAAAAQFSFSILTSSPLTTPGVTLNGDDQTTTFTIDTEVSSTNGNKAGWNVTASATTPTSGSYTLPALVVTGGSTSCLSSCSVNPSSSVSYPITMSGSAQEIYNAAASTGTGDFDVANTFRLTVPADTIRGTYTSTITLSGSTGP